MRIFLDCADIEDIQPFMDMGCVDGITTNPSLMAKHAGKAREVIHDICRLVPGPVSVEVIATEADAMIEEGRHLARIADNVVVKVPLTADGLKACHVLTHQHSIAVNVTLCFSPTQAILAAKAGAAYISPFVGRLDDIAYDGMELIDKIIEAYRNYPEWNTEVLVASVRSPRHVLDAAMMGADVVTLPPKVLRDMLQHPLTTIGIDRFLKDWQDARGTA